MLCHYQSHNCDCNHRRGNAGCGLLHPRTRPSITYDMLQMALLWYIVATVPVRLVFLSCSSCCALETLTPYDGFVQWRIAFNIKATFDSNAAAFLFDLVVDLAIVFDIGLNLRRYYFDDRSHKLITDPATIRMTYMKSWFLIDLISVIPFDRIVAALDTGRPEQMRSTKMVRLARLARFARLARLTKLASLRRFTKMVNEMLRSIGVSKPGMEFLGRIAFLAGVVLFVTHVVACLWINSGRTYTERCVMLGEEGFRFTDEDWADCRRTPGDEGWTAGAGVPNWYANEYWGGAVASAHDDGDGVINTTEFLVWDLENYWTVYLDACYWVLVTMSTVGYGDITPKSSTERLFSCGVILLGAFVWAYIIGSFSATLNSMDRDKARYDEQMRSIKAMMKFHDVPQPLIERIDSFFEYKFESKTLFDDANIYEVLPARLRADLILHRYKNIINMIPFFRGCREDAIIEIVSRMKSFSVLPGDYLFHKGDPYVELIVLTKGRMAVVTEETTSDIMAAEYFPGAFFGENEFLGFARERNESIRARTFAEVSTLHPEDMEPILKIHIKLRRRLERYAKLKIEMEKGLADDLSKTQGPVDNETLMRLKEGIESAWENESKELRDAFDKVDKDASGYIDRWEIGELAKEMGR